MTPLWKEAYLSVIIYNGKQQTEKVLSAYHILESSREVIFLSDWKWAWQ